MDHRALIACIVLGFGSAVAAEQAPLAAAVVADLESAQEALAADDPAAALAALDAHAEVAHPAVHALRASAYDAAERDDEAVAEYRAAHELDRDLQRVALALINLHASRDDWGAVLDVAGTWLDRSTCPEGALILCAQAANLHGDPPLARRYAERALVRFPQSALPRRVLAAIELDAGDDAAARSLLRWLQARDGTDPELWRMQVAVAPDEDQRRRLLEIAALAGSDPTVHRAWVAALSDAGQHREALRQLDTFDLSDPTARDLALGVAAAAGDDARAAAILATIPEAERGLRHQRLAARLALAAGDPAAARAAFQRLLELGADDEATLLHAARLEEAQDAPAVAEALYRQAAQTGSVTARIYLARLLLEQGRREEARTLLATLAAEHPEIAVVRQMLAVLGDGSAGP